MFFISRLKLKNFKSFKIVNIPLPPTFICFAGPNGSGKSNLGDAIRFALGEMSLKSLRAKKVKDLIHHGARTAEVTIEFNEVDSAGSKKKGYELRRIIRDDGKIIYIMNGKKTTRTAILEAMKKFNLDDSGRNIIAQGEVARIINMNGKERRQIIDAVAGLSDFENKKNEAINELRTVEERIKDANLVLGEREVYLKELEKEKEQAIKYRECKKTLASAKATLLKRTIDHLQKDLGSVNSVEEKLLSNIREAEQELEIIAGKINEVEKQRMETSSQLQEKQTTSKLVQRIEELKASLGSKAQMISDKEEYIQKLKSESGTLSMESKNDKKLISDLDGTISDMKKELKCKEQELCDCGGPIESGILQKIESELQALEEKMAKTKEQCIVLEGQVESKKEIMKLKIAEAQEIKLASEKNDLQQTEKEISTLKKRAKEAAEEIDQYFQRTKNINSDIVELDKKMLELKEQASICRARASPQLLNPALKFITDMKEKKEGGIYGTVADLVSFDAKYADAVEAAGGARLLYVIVDTVDTATDVIEKLKKVKAGRASFIPLDIIKTLQITNKEAFRPVLDVVRYPTEIKKAVEFVFGDTFLIKNASDAKKTGIGNVRFVTLEGEIFERSGVVSGGKQQSSILNANQLKKLEDELTKIKSEKETLIQELYSIREAESDLRAKKTEYEIKIRTIEIELKQAGAIAQEEKRLSIKKKELIEEAELLGKEIERLSEKKNTMLVLAKELENETKTKKGELSKMEAEIRDASDESNRKRTEISSSISSIKATIDGKLNELEIRKNEIHSKEQRLKEIEKELQSSYTKIDKLKKEISGENEQLYEIEEKMKSTSKTVEKLFEKMKLFELELQNLGKLRAEKRIEADRFNKDLTQLSIKKATSATRLEDLRAEYESYKDHEFFDNSFKKDDLQRMISENEELLGQMVNVNLAAVEMYEKRKEEIDEVKKRIEKLSEEREAILNMINEIEMHKKEAFFETFDAVSNNFKKIFSHINIGEGYIMLDDPNEPFESGLYIKIKRGNNNHSIDSLSGGENSLVALMFIFALQFYKPSPFYILDEVDAALDKENSKNLMQLVSGMAKSTQFIIVSHNDVVMGGADVVLGVTKKEGISKLVGIKLEQNKGEAA